MIEIIFMAKQLASWGATAGAEGAAAPGAPRLAGPPLSWMFGRTTAADVWRILTESYSCIVIVFF